MTMLRNHALISRKRLTPELVTDSDAIINNVSSGNFTTLVTPTEGNFLFIMIGGVQTRTPGALSGWTLVNVSPVGGGTDWYYYKTAGASEPTSWAFTLSGALQGGWIFMEIKNVDVADPFAFETHNTSGGASVGSHNFPSFPIDRPEMAVCRIVLGAASSTWVLTNNFTTLTADASNLFFKGGYRRYPFIDQSETVGYTSSNARVVFGGVFGINGKKQF